MLYFVAFCVATSVAFAVIFLLQVSPRRTVVSRRLDELEQSRYGPLDQLTRRRRLEQSERLKEILQLWGEKVEANRPDNETVRLFLIQAGYMNPNSVAYYWGARLMLTVGLAAVGVLFAPLLGRSPMFSMLVGHVARGPGLDLSRRSTCGAGSSGARRPSSGRCRTRST